MDQNTIWRCAADIPPEWYEDNRDGLEYLVQQLFKRRGQIRKLVDDFRTSPRKPFPNWKDSMAVAVTANAIPTTLAVL